MQTLNTRFRHAGRLHPRSTRRPSTLSPAAKAALKSIYPVRSLYDSGWLTAAMLIGPLLGLAIAFLGN